MTSSQSKAPSKTRPQQNLFTDGVEKNIRQQFRAQSKSGYWYSLEALSQLKFTLLWKKPGEVLPGAGRAILSYPALGGYIDGLLGHLRRTHTMLSGILAPAQLSCLKQTTPLLGACSAIWSLTKFKARLKNTQLLQPLQGRVAGITHGQPCTNAQPTDTPTQSRYSLPPNHPRFSRSAGPNSFFPTIPPRPQAKKQIHS